MSSERFAARSLAQRRRRRQRIGIAVLATLVVCSLVWVVMFSDVLAVRRVVVDGESTLSESQIRRAADVDIGEPLARIDVAGIESRIAAMERVSDVTVGRTWPHTVHITVSERTPVAYILIGGRIRALDRDGIDFRTYAKAPEDLLEVKVTATDSRQRQQTLEAVAAVVQLIRSDDPDLADQVRSVSAASKDSIELDLTRGRTVVWGSGVDSQHKRTVLHALLRIKATRYDVSAPDQPTTRR